MRGCLYDSDKVCDWKLKQGLVEKPGSRKCSVCKSDGCNSS